MMRDDIDFMQLEPDIVAVILRQCLAACPTFSPALARQIEEQVRATHGGQRLFVPKGSKRLTAQDRAALYQDGLSGAPTEEILKKHKISRATLYRTMKSGGRFG